MTTDIVKQYIELRKMVLKVTDKHIAEGTVPEEDKANIHKLKCYNNGGYLELALLNDAIPMLSDSQGNISYDELTAYCVMRKSVLWKDMKSTELRCKSMYMPRMLTRKQCLYNGQSHEVSRVEAAFTSILNENKYCTRS